MKRNKLLKHLGENACVFNREGGNHTMFRNVINGKVAMIPRHPDIDEYTAAGICKQLGIPKPKIN